MTFHPSSMRLSQLLTEAGLPVPEGAEQITVSGVSTDSRRVLPGNLFVAIRGFRTGGRTYAPEAVANGAAVIVQEDTDRELPASDAFTVIVPNARTAAACLLDAWYGHPSKELCLVGVTGTNGKTSVSTMLHAILREAGIPCGLIGTIGCFLPGDNGPSCESISQESKKPLYSGMTTPDPDELYPLLARMAARAPTQARRKTVVIMEVTSHALCLARVAPLTFDLAVFTNLSSEHMDFHGTMEDYYEAKLRLFEVSREAVINADDRWGRRLLAEPAPVHHYHICHAEGLQNLSPDRMCPAGEGTCTRYYAEQIKYLGGDGVSFKLTSPDVRLRIRCPVPGKFTVMNAMEAAVAALTLGVSPSAVRDALASFAGVPGRMERICLPDTDIPFSVFIDFAHTPDALEKLLASVHGFRRRGQRIVLVFGCGGDRDRSKRKMMARIASRMADSLVITSDNSRTEDPNGIIADILAGVDKESEFAVVPNRAEAIRYAVRHARAGDIILLAGKGHENYEIDREGKHPFCEKDIAERNSIRFIRKPHNTHS